MRDTFVWIITNRSLKCFSRLYSNKENNLELYWRAVEPRGKVAYGRGFHAKWHVSEVNLVPRVFSLFKIWRRRGKRKIPKNTAAVCNRFDGKCKNKLSYSCIMFFFFASPSCLKGYLILRDNCLNRAARSTFFKK